MFSTKNYTLFFTLSLFSILCKGSLPNIPTAIAYQDLAVLPSGSSLHSTLQDFLARNQGEQTTIIALNPTAIALPIESAEETTDNFCQKKICNTVITLLGYGCIASCFINILGVSCLLFPDTTCPHLGYTILKICGPISGCGCCCFGAFCAKNHCRNRDVEE